MSILLLMCVGGFFAGLLLLRRVPVVTARLPATNGHVSVSVIIPARNEEANLPMLLESLSAPRIGSMQLIVVDDGSTDNTSGVAARYGATVICSAPLPAGWTGKTWACHQGALAATGEIFCFLDADTRFVRDGYARIVETFPSLPQNTVLSVLPFHRIERWYEELSLFFNIVMAMGAGGFGKLDAPHLFGQSLLVRREMYFKSGGHESVKSEILENLNFASRVIRSQGSTCALGGRGTLEMRMFPHGVAQLRESWQKAFAAGAGRTSPFVLWLSIYWLSAAMLACFMPMVTNQSLRSFAIAVYLFSVIQIAWYGRQLGTFRLAAALLYPIALMFYFATFAQSMWRQRRGKPAAWRGRTVC
jgi:4,4'-diaponeurosporenoate glycosyltransferase